MKIITKKDWERIESLGIEAFKNARGCRQAVTAETKAICDAVRMTSNRKWKGWEKDTCLIIRIKQRNYGTRKWSDYRECIDVVPVHPAAYKETAKYVYGIKKDTIIAVVKRG